MPLEITAAETVPELLTLPWEVPLEGWPADITVAMPRGISRNVVRFVRLRGAVFAIKELPPRLAWHEYELLGILRKRDVPVVAAVGVVSGRVDGAGDPLMAALVTRHLPFSLPYRALFSTRPTAETADRLVDALVMLLVRLHLVGFMWGDCSLSNTLFRRDAGEFEAYLVDAETGELRERLSDGQRAMDVDLAMEKCTGELLDLQAAGALGEGVDPFDIGGEIPQRYARLWAMVSDELRVAEDELWRIEERVRALNEAGFDVGEMSMSRRDEGGHRVVVMRPRVVESGHNSRRLYRLTGLDAGENQARRLLADIDQYRAWAGLEGLSEAEAATAWLREQYQPTVSRVPPELRGRLEPPEVFHEVLAHRWQMCQRESRDVPWAEGVSDYLREVLRHKPEEAVVTPVVDPVAAAVELTAADEPGPRVTPPAAES